jgi:hypothetical protein
MSDKNDKGKTTTNMRACLFKNKNKKTTNQPDYVGNGLIDEQEYLVAGWINKTEEYKYISVSFTKIEDVQPKDDDDLF